jgi:hypothetical protein
MNRAPAKCQFCKVRFTPEERGKRLHDQCTDSWIQAFREKQEKKAQAARAKKASAERKDTRQKLDGMKTIPMLIKEADRAFQAWVKERDRQAGYDCISSGRPLEWGTLKTNAGHFRSKGAASALRYHPDNCHAQSQHDNLYKSGNISAYRVRLIERIGLERVEALECMNAVHQWEKDELIGIKATYVAKLKLLKSGSCQEQPAP